MSSSTGITPPMGCRVVIADDHAIVRAGLARVIEMQPGFRVVGQANDGEQAWTLLRSQKPDVAVLDIDMPGVDGFEVLQRARAEGLDARFVLLTQHADQEYLQRARDLGALGYVLKESALAELVAAITSAMDGEVYVSPAGQRLPSKTSSLPDDLARMVSRLTPTEKVILRYLAQNLTSKEIALAINVSYRTVQNHRANICAKLSMRGNNRLLQFALEYRDQLSTLA